MSIVSTYVGDPVFRRIESKDFTKTYYLNTEVLNAGDHVLVDVHDPGSYGYGGSRFAIKTTTGEVDEVKGPWHGTCPYDVFNTSELHFTKVIIWADWKHIPYEEWSKSEAVKTGCMCLECTHHIRGSVIYQEDDMVLGSFYRGDRIAQQLADLRNETLYMFVQTAGGSHAHECKPGKKLHPLAHRSDANKDDDLSAEQMGIVHG